MFETSLLLFVILDLTFGGNGYLIKIAGLRIRELLFIICMIWVALRLTRIHRIAIDPKIFALLGWFGSVTALGVLIGWIAGSSQQALLAELKPLAYFPMILFFAVAIREPSDVRLVLTVFAAGALILSVLYLAVLISAWLGLVRYASVYEFLRVSDEFIFRHNPVFDEFIGFLYKGMFYTCVGVIVLTLDPYRTTKVFALVGVLAVAMTLTRGLGLSLAVCVIIGVLLANDWRRAPLKLALTTILLVVLFKAQQIETKMLIAGGDIDPIAWEMVNSGGRSPKDLEEFQRNRRDADTKFYFTRPTDSSRTEDARYVLSNMSSASLVVGHGLGVPIRGRSRIETTYLEILFKQGLMGLSIWAAIFLWIGLEYLKLPKPFIRIGASLFLSAFFVFLVTATNTFLTGSIGMAVVFIALTGLKALQLKQERPVWYFGLSH